MSESDKKEYNRLYYINNKHKFNKCKENKREYNKQYRKINKDYLQTYMKIYNKNYKIKNKEVLSIRRKEYNALNKDKINEYFRNYFKKYFIKKPNAKIAARLRTRIWFVLNNEKKHKHTLEFLGIHLDEFMGYIASKFTEGMSWNNYGEWHIDHIKPCAAFDLSDPEQQKQCFHYTNLQPLWAKDNIIKKDKYVEKIN